jgi:hypothetical protein
MKAQITKRQDGLDIDIQEIEGKKEKLLEAFHECSEGTCTCPTDEYEKMESLHVVDGGDTIQLSLKTKEGEEIDTDAIEKCLDYTKKRVSAPPEAENTPKQD